MVALRLTTPPTIEPLSLTEAKAHLRYEESDKDTDIEALIVMARQACEVATNRAMLTQDWVLALDGFPGRSGIIELLRPPLQEVLEITYTDLNGEAQNLSAEYYQVDTISEPGRVMPARNCLWPETDSGTMNAVQISYRAGWETAAEVPAQVIGAMKLFVAHYFENLSAVLTGLTPAELPLSARWLLQQIRVPFLG